MEILSKKEFNFLKKLKNKIKEITAPTEEKRQYILQILQEECEDKGYTFSIDKTIEYEDQLIYLFSFNKKGAMIIFEKFNNFANIIVPTQFKND